MIKMCNKGKGSRGWSTLVDVWSLKKSLSFTIVVFLLFLSSCSPWWHPRPTNPIPFSSKQSLTADPRSPTVRLTYDRIFLYIWLIRPRAPQSRPASYRSARTLFFFPHTDTPLCACVCRLYPVWNTWGIFGVDLQLCCYDDSKCKLRCVHG